MVAAATVARVVSTAAAAAMESALVAGAAPREAVRAGLRAKKLMAVVGDEAKRASEGRDPSHRDTCSRRR